MPVGGQTINKTVKDASAFVISFALRVAFQLPVDRYDSVIRTRNYMKRMLLQRDNQMEAYFFWLPFAVRYRCYVLCSVSYTVSTLNCCPTTATATFRFDHMF